MQLPARVPQNATQTFEELVIIRDGQRVHPGSVFYRESHQRYECIFETNGETGLFGSLPIHGAPAVDMPEQPDYA